jgi:flagellar biosynthesis protein FlhG
MRAEAMGMNDQAEGLRRMFAKPSPAVLPILVPGGGQGALVANLCIALARGGRDVVVIDATPGEVALAMGLRQRYEMAHVLAGDKQMSDIVLAPLARLRIVPASRALNEVRELEPWLGALAARLTPQPDLFVVHQRAATSLFDGDVLVAPPPAADALTRTYAELKRMRRGHGRVHLVVARAADEDGARTLHRALDETAQRYLGEGVDWAGFIPHDASLRRAEAAFRPVFDIDTGAPSALALMALGRALDNWRLPRLQTAAH